MFKCKKNKLWLESVSNLFCSFNLIPLDGMSLAEQMNSITRLVLVVFLVLLLLGFRYSILFLLLSLLFIIIIYYIQRNNMETFKAEYYIPHQSDRNTETNPRIGRQNIIFNDPSSKRFCNDKRPLDGPDNNPNWMSVNQKLAGPANPKTLIPPVVVAPSADMSYWRANNLVEHSAINAGSQIDVFRSGYQVSTCCAPSYDCSERCKIATPAFNPLSHNVPLTEGYCGPGQCGNNRRPRSHPRPHPGPAPAPGPQGSGGGMADNHPAPQKVGYPYNQHTKENFGFPYLKTSDDKGLVVRPNEPGQVNVSCGYNPEQLFKAGLPTNLPAGKCTKDPLMKQYNQNLYTQTIQPGVYTRSEVNEPINSNIGISFTQQFEPTTCQSNPNTGDVLYTEHDPRIIEPAISEPNLAVMSAVTESNIYDPRFSGYGTSYRSYTDDNVGQTRFYYDDVNAVRMPNYIVRSNIDNQPFADQYGPIPAGEEQGNKYNPDIRALANAAFLDGSLQHRTELQERLMRKANTRAAQQRLAPIRTSGQRMLGGMGGCNR